MHEVGARCIWVKPLWEQCSCKDQLCEGCLEKLEESVAGFEHADLEACGRGVFAEALHGI